jgi:hypothetical protein
MARIPKILHYVFGMARDFGGKPWSLVHHVCLKSAVDRIKPDDVFFYYEHEPRGPWWDLSKRLVTPVKIVAPTQIFDRPLSHVAHRADVVRLQKLIQHGGIYLDADVLVQRDFDDLLDFPAVLGREGEEGVWGTANAVILAERESGFLKRWLEEYKSFRSMGRDEFWNEHSVQIPSRLARQHPTEVVVLSENAFFWPLWTDDHLNWIFNTDRPIPLDETYANHLWEARAWKYLEGLTLRHIRSTPSNFNSWAKPLLEGVPDNYGAPSLSSQVKRLGSALVNAARRIKASVAWRIKRMESRVSRLSMSPSEARRDIFSEVYSKKLWGKDSASPFFSGVGSRGRSARDYVQKMSEILSGHAAELGRPLTIVDLGCGDFYVGRALLEFMPGTRYIGCDIVPSLIEHNRQNFGSNLVQFQVLDIVPDRLPEGDVCLVRHVFQHLSNAEISEFLNRHKYALMYVTEGHPAERAGDFNPDKTAGADVRFDWLTGRGRGVELDKPPFNRRSVQAFHTVAPPNEVVVTERILAP